MASVGNSLLQPSFLIINHQLRRLARVKRMSEAMWGTVGASLLKKAHAFDALWTVFSKSWRRNSFWAATGMTRKHISYRESSGKHYDRQASHHTKPEPVFSTLPQLQCFGGEHAYWFLCPNAHWLGLLGYMRWVPVTTDGWITWIRQIFMRFAEMGYRCQTWYSDIALFVLRQ